MVRSRPQITLDHAINSTRWRGYLWLAVCAVVGVALVFLFLDSYQQDGGYHFILSRWGWRHHEFFIGVWSRPLFTFLYAFPALIGYRTARVFTVLISVLTAWQTWRVARFYGLERSELVIPFLLFQPVFFLLWADTMTEPIFALVFVTALHLHLTGRVKLGALVASMMILARPEGAFLGAMWGFWLLFDRRLGPTVWKRAPWTLILATGGIIWILVSWAISGDIQYIRHHWPQDWSATESTYGRGPVWDYVLHLPEIVGPLLVFPFLIGLWKGRRRFWHVTLAFITLFVLHTILHTVGRLGSAGYARYFVCVGPAIALITLVGWNKIAEWVRPRALRVGLGAAVLLISGSVCFLYTDAMIWTRDAIAVDEMYTWWRQNERPVTTFVRSNAYQAIVIDRDPEEQPQFNNNREQNLQRLREMPRGTLVFWDGQTGPAWYKLTADDIEATGYRRLRSRNYVLRGYVMKYFWFGYGDRIQEMHLLYKE